MLAVWTAVMNEGFRQCGGSTDELAILFFRNRVNSVRLGSIAFPVVVFTKRLYCLDSTVFMDCNDDP